MTSTIVHSGGASSGYLVAPIAVTSTSLLGSVPTGGFALSTSAFSQTNTGNAARGYIWAQQNSTASIQQTLGANLAGWFVYSDAAGVFENTSTVAGMARPPDFVIPYPSTSTTVATSGNYFAQGGAIDLPWSNFKLFIQSNLGVTVGATFAQIFIGPVADDIV